jgi:hypothetical protein
VAADALAAILTLALLALVILLLSGPFRPGRNAHGGTSAPAPHERSALEAEREAKYSEIRDAELDFRTGKLSAEDHDLIAATLRAEAAEILKRLRRLEGDAARAQDHEQPRARAGDSAGGRDGAGDA